LNGICIYLCVHAMALTCMYSVAQLQQEWLGMQRAEDRIRYEYDHASRHHHVDMDRWDSCWTARTRSCRLHYTDEALDQIMYTSNHQKLRWWICTYLCACACMYVHSNHTRVLQIYMHSGHIIVGTCTWTHATPHGAVNGVLSQVSGPAGRDGSQIARSQP
jgi:hypothetical protein